MNRTVDFDRSTGTAWSWQPKRPPHTRRVDQASFIRQAQAAERMWAEHVDLLQQEVNCWRMYGLDVDLGTDWVSITAP